MNKPNYKLAEGLVPANYVRQAVESRNTRENLVKTVLSQRRLPVGGWDDATIKLFLQDLSLMDSNNFNEYSGAGEREGRIESSLVRDMHNGMGHGIGRSGDISAHQPKAAGSSLMSKLTQYFMLEILKLSGATRTKSCYVFPLATGMAVVMCLLALKAKNPTATHVVWPRIDQKTCLKAIVATGFIPVVIENITEDNDKGPHTTDELRTDLPAIEDAIKRAGGPEKVLCVLSTTSCFAPRAFDKVSEIAVMCERLGIAHVVNNAYGVTSSLIMHHVNEAMRLGRVDAYVQSTDKNFLVPVGGSVIAGPDKHLKVADVCKTYPGRASGTPTLDVFITLLSMGSNGYKHRLLQRKEIYEILKQKMSEVAAKHGERLLHTPHNPISLAITITPRRRASSQTEVGDRDAQEPESTSGTWDTVGNGMEALDTRQVEPDSHTDIDTASSSTRHELEKHKALHASHSGGVQEVPIDTITSFSMLVAVSDETENASSHTPTKSHRERKEKLATNEGSSISKTSAQHSAARSAPRPINPHPDSDATDVTRLGAMLFRRGVSGARVVSADDVKVVAGVSFKGYGAHADAYFTPYLTVAAALGMTRKDVEQVVERIDKTLTEYFDS
ncbi:O-phosphoseryl-tRNA(Sec) selenium transferase [Sphaeroforma arctica JP610]|uniref:O-phosphoseryl-tRNA(Sec) selenium transferase n=1 Tax=Sphaeroforma arctica JP610 TaxID=667725 RepID=A0A0L0FPK6_9EUKA|nr:O-phosphoseryl-tRNA(Sec) selenium transferase [Sphaeroforma arctica JP610]KNC78737.1 O-phosphoseryl-tRNA(Sec) selenium transferase [Sphaeroforma arctica JP610]|eukprot:XP_014152639.1 O-phosphoseryl-tRNA(Sec) selenium transferase [Sphaeroforma arctica JP610]